MTNKKPCCRITGGFFKNYQELVRTVSIPYQWKILNDWIPGAEKSGAVHNLKLAAKLAQGEYYGTCFQDSDVGKWLEAVAYTLEIKPDPKLEALADSAILLLEKAQQEDGYLNSYFTVKEPDNRFKNLRECCEHYCFGHLAEAGVAYYEATGKDSLLKIACRYADLLCHLFGPHPGQSRGYDGHPEAELALVRLYEVTGKKSYLNLAEFFLNVRGEEPYYMEIEWEKRNRSWHYERNKDINPRDDKVYDCAHIQPRFQKKADGHAVKVGYLLTGMAAVAAHTKDEQLLIACVSIYNNIINQRMYLTGGIGSSRHQERFTFDYDLPNDRAYAETCAAVSLSFFSRRMLDLIPDSTYADTLERVLYNGSISGMSLDGTHFFYLNPLEILPDACLYNQDFKYVKPLRPQWLSCACCPPNLIRLLASVHRYLYTVRNDAIYVNLYASSETTLTQNGKFFYIRQETSYPWKGEILFHTEGFHPDMLLALRIPGWCTSWKLLNRLGQERHDFYINHGYLYLSPAPNDCFLLQLDMTPYCVKANCLTKSNVGKAALMRGPIVYCMEELDNGPQLYNILVSPEGSFNECLSSEFSKGELPTLPPDSITLYENAVFLETQKAIREIALPEQSLYERYHAENTNKICARFIPYFLWGNRNGKTPREMQVWFRTM